MMLVDLLSDTTYRDEAVKQLNKLLGNSPKFPVESTQIYGLRQIARQQPKEIDRFAEHQCRRVQRRYEEENERRTPRDDVLQELQAVIDFWVLVTNLCSNSASGWSVVQEGHRYLPKELREENLPPRSRGATPQETQANLTLHNQFKNRQTKRLDQWKNEHIPAFFERFCTQCLYLIAKAEMKQLSSEDDAHAQPQQEQNEDQDTSAIHAAFQHANLTE